MILIAGPCVIEDYDTLYYTAKKLKDIIKYKIIDFYFKSSILKDNRTYHDSYKGVDFIKGIKYLQNIRDEFNIKITTDFHSVEQIKEYGNKVDLIQIPAFLAKQTSLLKAAVETGNEIHIKKPQHLGPVEANFIIDNIYKMNYNNSIIISDRGTLLGYNKTFLDPRHIPIMKNSSAKVLADITHPNKNYPYNNFMKLSQTLAKASIAAGADGLFIETHPNCNEAKCDSGTMYPLKEMEKLIKDIYELYQFINGGI